MRPTPDHLRASACIVLGQVFPHARPVGSEPAAASGGNRQAERRESQGAARGPRACEFPGSKQHGEKRPGESCSRAVFSQVQHCTWLGYLLPAVENLAAVHLPAAADDVLNKGVKIQGNSSFAQLAGCAALLDTASGA